MREPSSAGAGPLRWFYRGSAVTIVIGALLCGFLSWLALHFLAGIAADPPYPADEIPGFVRATVARRGLVPLLALPAVVCGVLLWRTRRRSVLLLLAATLSLLAPFALTITCFVLLIAPMYEYREI